MASVEFLKRAMAALAPAERKPLDELIEHCTVERIANIVAVYLRRAANGCYEPGLTRWLHDTLSTDRRQPGSERRFMLTSRALALVFRASSASHGAAFWSAAEDRLAGSEVEFEPL